MSVNTDAAKSLQVTFRAPRKGSCLTKEILAELASLIQVTIAAGDAQAAPCVSNTPGNLASLDAEDCILVPGAKLYTEDQEFDASAPADITFDGFAAQGFDATTCFIGMIPRWSSTEVGREFLTSSGPDVKDTVFPTWRYKSITASGVVISVEGATEDATFTLQLLQLPVANETA